MEKKLFNFEKRIFSGRGRQSLHIHVYTRTCINVMRIHEMLIYCWIMRCIQLTMVHVTSGVIECEINGPRSWKITRIIDYTCN